MTGAGERRSEPAWLQGCAGALLGGGPVWHYLFANGYPFSRTEAWLLPAAAAGIGACLSLLGRRAGGIAGSLVFAALLLVFVDLQFDLERVTRTWYVGLGCLLLAFALREHRALLACLMLGAFYGSSLARPPATWEVVAPSAPSLPPGSAPLLLHIILDEQWGVGGLRADGDSATANYMQQFFVDRGFEVYPAAFSRHRATRASIPATLALGRPYRLRLVDARSTFGESYRMDTVPYLERLRQLGYSISVFQNTYLDVCHAPGLELASCHQAPANSIANIGYLGGGWVSRGHLAVGYFVNVTSHLFVRLVGADVAWRRAAAGGALWAVATARARLEGAGHGNAVFMHLLLPHGPLELSDDCAPFANPGERVARQGGATGDTLAYAEWQRRYAGQVRCALKSVDVLLQAIDQGVGRDGAIVIVHGDHGSRASRTEPPEDGISHLTRDQLNAGFSTLLAVRRPGVSAAVHPDVIPVQDFVRELVAAEFRGSVRVSVPVMVQVLPTADEPADTLRVLTAGEVAWGTVPR